jgi:predicted dienelactone hydrolase
MKTIRLLALTVLWASFLTPAEAYDPLVVPQEGEWTTQDLTVIDQSRNREIPLRFYLPAKRLAAPVVLFSHGLGGSREMGKYLGGHWAGRGYVAVFLQHPGSDTSVWKGKPTTQIMKAMKEAANLENFLLRVKDVPAVLDQLELWNKEAGHLLSGRLDMDRVGMSGHSFGAVITQAVSGQKAAMGDSGFTEGRIKAAMPFSPSVPAMGNVEKAFGSVKVPWMLMTGTEDDSPIGNTTPESRQQVYPALPPGGKYELVLFGAKHSAFTDRSLPGDRGERNPNHHRAILALSTAFWDACLRGDGEAKAWLDGSGPASILESKDRWQRK